MKYNFLSCLIVIFFISCISSNTKQDVELADFTKELISMYINDTENRSAINRKDEIIIISIADSSYYYLSVFANNSKGYKFCREDFVGQTLHSGLLIRIFGNDSSAFYSVREKFKSQKRCKDNFMEYDPNVWRLCFDKDMFFCKMKTTKVNVNGDISEIQNLAEKYFRVSEIAENEVYQWHEVENNSKFSLGEDSLRKLIYSNFKVKRDSVQSKIPVVVDILIDKNGKAELKGVTKSSNDMEIDNEALRVAKIICTYDFIPASHRGEKVNVVYPIMFLERDIVKN